MGQTLGHLRGTTVSDLNDEQVEEIRMVTSLPTNEIHRIRIKYRTLAAQECMTASEFRAIPGIAVNPLRDRIFAIFELTPDGHVPFVEFARFIATYSFHSSQDSKLRESFRVHDFDGDGKISRSDLLQYLLVTYPAPSDENQSAEDAVKQQAEMIDMIITRVLEEASSDPTAECLHYEDFVKVIQPTDFESRLIFPF